MILMFCARYALLARLHSCYGPTAGIVCGLVPTEASASYVFGTPAAVRARIPRRHNRRLSDRLMETIERLPQYPGHVQK